MFYRFHGAGAAGDIIQECTNYPANTKNANLDYLTNDFWPSHNKLRNNVFDKFFTLEHTVHLAEGTYYVVINTYFHPLDLKKILIAAGV